MGKREWLSEASKAGVEANRIKRDELKARFIAAVEAGESPTKTKLVVRSTYYDWRRDDKDFAKRIDTILASRPSRTDILKARFIAAIEAGAELTKTGVVAPRTYQVWRRDDAEFSAKVDAILAARRAARPAYKRPSRAKVYGLSAMNQLTSDATYVKAISLLAGRKLAPDIREAAISIIMLQILEGETSDAGRAVHEAKAEHSQFVGFGRRAELTSIWEYVK